VLSQDGNQRKRKNGEAKEWTVTKYDVFGRIVFTGLNYRITADADTAGCYSGLRQTFKSELVLSNYSANGLDNCLPLTINYYDNYSFAAALPSTVQPYLNYEANSGYDKAYPTTVTSKEELISTGLLTGTRTYLLDGSGNYTVSVLYYDHKGQVVQSRSTNHLGGYDMVYNTYNFSGKPTSTYKTHNISGQSTVTERYTYSYDHALRPLVTNYYLNGGNAVTLASNTYDELGRLQSKTLGGADVTTYTYNIRGWVKDITGAKFTENLYYNANTANLPNFTPAYNGNIAGMKWNVPNENLGYSRAYSFTYDGLNRLTDATYAGINSNVLTGTLNRYDEHFLFDKMGNTTSFTRNGLQSGLGGYGTIDNLSFTYQGNQRIKTIDSGTNGIFYGSEEFVLNSENSGNSCAYDANGNRLYDSNSNIWGIRYNTLNLPDAMQFYQGHQTIYTYSAAGVKLRVVDKTAPEGVTLPVTTLNTILTNPTASATTITDYVGNIIYENGTLKRILTPVGYWQGGTYYYFLKDHLGSNRVVISGSGTVLETSSYYPSGMRFGESTVNGGSAQPYRHTGHEMQQMHGLNWIDNLARFRTVSDGGGFTSVDPLAELMPGISPYAYCYNNPIKYIDPLGLAGEDNKDMWGRDRFDPFTNMYIAPMDRPGGATAQGYGDTNYGHWEPTKVYKQYSYTMEDKESSVGLSSVTVGYDEYDYGRLNFVWNSSEEGMYGSPRGLSGSFYAANSLTAVTLSGTGLLKHQLIQDYKAGGNVDEIFKAANQLKKISKPVAIIGKVLGVVSAAQHGMKIIDAINQENVNWNSVVINGGKFVLDVVFMVGKSVNPLFLGASVIYGVVDYITEDY
jgi:RHS repeat-associated protein